MNDPGTKSKRTTIYDIAARVGTSAATVSRTLGNSGYPVKEELRRKIEEAARELNYSPNMIGRMLKKNESRDIGIIIPTITNPYYSSVILGIELEARKQGYNILLCDSFRDAAIERQYIESLCQKQVRGIILSSIHENQAFLKSILDDGVRIVAFDQGTSGFQCDLVGFNYFKGGMMAVEYLLDMGHRDIAFLTSPLNKKSRREVLDGYRYALIKNGRPYREEFVLELKSEGAIEYGRNEFENGKKLAQEFLAMPERPGAVLAINDITAFGIIQELLDRGIGVPEDVSVVGFDNLDVSSMINPPLTTISQPALETGRQACRMLLDGMSGERTGNISIMMEPALVVRKSVKDLR